MALNFDCENCGASITVRFLQPGERAECRRCGHRPIVPEDAATADEVSPLPAPASRAERRPSVGRSFGPMTVGSLLGATFSAFANNFVVFTGLLLVLTTPAIIYNYLALQQLIEHGPFDPAGGVDIIGVIFPVILDLIATGAVAYGVVEYLRGRRASFGRCLTVAAKRLLPLVGTAVLAGLAIGIGTLMFLIPGVIVTCMFWLAVPITVLEEAGPGASLSRSYDLTNGYKGRIFGFLLVIGLMDVALAIMSGSVWASARDPDTVVIVWWVGVGVSLFTGTLRAIGAGVAYHAIVTEREGTDIDELVSVFE